MIIFVFFFKVMREHEQSKGVDALLFGGSNNLDSEPGSGPSHPPGFIGYPQPPMPPQPAFNYPVSSIRRYGLSRCNHSLDILLSIPK